jgi:hypothetical protein
MHGTRWYSFKHNSWAVVTDEPRTKRGFYTVEFDKGIFRRYNAERIRYEAAEYVSVDSQLAAQLSPNPIPMAPAQAHAIATLTTDTTWRPSAFDKTNVSSPFKADTRVATVTQRAPRKGILIGLIFEKR